MGDYFEAVENCPHCGEPSIFPLWDVEKRGYVARCQTCGKEMMLCDECLHSDDNPSMTCDWTDNGTECGTCFRRRA